MFQEYRDVRHALPTLGGLTCLHCLKRRVGVLVKSCTGASKLPFSRKQYQPVMVNYSCSLLIGQSRNVTYIMQGRSTIIKPCKQTAEINTLQWMSPWSVQRVSWVSGESLFEPQFKLLAMFSHTQTPTHTHFWNFTLSHPHVPAQEESADFTAETPREEQELDPVCLSLSANYASIWRQPERNTCVCFEVRT